MQELSNFITPPVLFVVAHWDDEALNFGIALQRFGKGADVVCVTEKEHDYNFKAIFNGVCYLTGANPISLGIMHRSKGYNPLTMGRELYQTLFPLTELTPDLILEKLVNVVPISKYNTIITHNFDGDAGFHHQHIEVAQAVKFIFNGSRAKVFMTNYASCGDFRLKATALEAANRQNWIRAYKPNWSIKPLMVEFYDQMI